MPRVTPWTFRRLHEAAAGHDGAFLTDADGRRQLAGVLDAARLDAVRPDHEGQHGMALHRLLAGLDLVDVAPEGDEGRDVDTWADLRDLWRPIDARGCGRPVVCGKSGPVNLHDWIDELSDVLDVDTEVDEALVLDLARVAAHNVARPAAPITTYLLGFAAGSQDADPEAIEALAARVAAARRRLGPARGRPGPGRRQRRRSPTTARSTTPARPSSED